MGQAAIKATRRDIRRAVGAEVLTTISEHEGGIHWCVQRINELRTASAAQTRDITRLSAQTAVHADVLEGYERDRTAIEHDLSTFLGRLRWLFLGR